MPTDPDDRPADRPDDVDVTAADVTAADATAADATAADATAADATVADAAAADPDGVPSEEELLRTARPARVRRAPKLSAFLVAGTLAGAVLGLVLSAFGDGGGAAAGSGFIPLLEGDDAARTYLVLTGAGLGLLVGMLVATIADRRASRPSRPGARRGGRRR
ncbi:histidine kinase [Cellulomonas marina]|uniref:Histidine kinase n=1 Tax=Cellulomonas marina TaxID=988821 RepID=A0A1I0Z2Y9_9CELL|nr:histidine kinase [Cellulomonas marina]GIG28211.1 hypothetical protein Cma02nite_08110 [Cellulomonas marina]SFB19984.1 hypothetical protein SAMN05421867_109152 [Cellulomonas marina]